MKGLASTFPVKPVVRVEDDLLSTLARHGNVHRLAVDEIFIREGEPSFNIYILLSGRVKVFGSADNDREVVYNVLGPGEFVGEMCLDGGSRSASVVAIEPTSCVVVSSDELRAFMAEYPDFAFVLVKKLIQRARHATEYIKSLALDDVYQRTSRLLNSLSREDGERWVVTESITQKDIADRVGATREMVNRVIRQLQMGGYLIKEGRRIVLLKRLPERW